MRTIDWTDPAIADLEDIDDYWSAYALDAAERVAGAIERAAAFLTTTPSAGPAVDALDARKWRVAKTDYILIYRLVDDRIEVLRIRHARENWMAR